jgi:hypothetical protein
MISISDGHTPIIKLNQWLWSQYLTGIPQSLNWISDYDLNIWRAYPDHYTESVIMISISDGYTPIIKLNQWLWSQYLTGIPRSLYWISDYDLNIWRAYLDQIWCMHSCCYHNASIEWWSQYPQRQNQFEYYVCIVVVIQNQFEYYACIVVVMIQH